MIDNATVKWGEGPEAGRCFWGTHGTLQGLSSQPLAWAAGASCFQKQEWISQFLINCVLTPNQVSRLHFLSQSQSDLLSAMFCQWANKSN